MADRDYIVKVLLIGDDSEGKSYLANKYSKKFFTRDYKSTIGVEFHVKYLTVQGKTMKMQLWEVALKERFRFHAFIYFRGANGAIIISDVSKFDFQDNLNYNIKMVKEQVGDVPIILLAFNRDLEEIQAFSGVEAMLTADRYNGSKFNRFSLKSIQNPDVIFTKLAEYMIKRYEISPPPRPIKRPIRNEFIINKYLKLKLEYSYTNIYVGDKLFRQCKYLLLDIPVNNITDYDEIESIDEAAERLDRSMERGYSRKYRLSPDIEFWGHCSNLQVWYENNYDTRILHSNLAFPLLEDLVKAGDPLAKKMFKEEICSRFANGYPSVVQYLINEDYLKYLTKEELNTLLEDRNFIKNLPKWYYNIKDMPKWLSKRIIAKLNDLECPF
ncbi:MAG: GTP-binding protein [Candidatus Thorarchaeota archaeon]